MERKSLKLLAITFCVASIGIFSVSVHKTHADGEKNIDILKRLGDYRSWTQIKKDETPAPLTTGSITLSTIEIAESSVAG